MTEINLAAKTIAKIRKTQRAKHWLDQALLGWGLLLSLALMVIAGLNLSLSRANLALNTRIKTKEKEIESLSKIENQQVYLNSKLTAFAALIKTHNLNQSIAETVFNLIPDGTSLKGFSVSETGVISLSGSVGSWQLLSQLLNNLSLPTSPLTVSHYLIKKINFSQSGGISFDLELTIKI